MKVLVSGASGFLGQHLLPMLHFRGHHATPLLRGEAREGQHTWDPATNRLDSQTLSGFDAVIHLSGEQVAERWSPEKKNRIYGSRINSTKLLADTIAAMNAAERPRIFLSASAIGFYGNRGSEVLVEDSAAGKGFLSKVCVDWESATAQASMAGVRTSSLRFGIVLSTTGGAFPRILKPFKMGAGGRLGSGQQYMSWITVADAVEAVNFVLERDAFAGPVNIVAPQPVTNNDFVTALGKVLHCDRLIPVPAAMAHIAFGSEMCNEVLFGSTRAMPERLSAGGFQFKYGQLAPALEHLVHERG